ncbi:MAG: 50S ribosomal protein L2 [Candidatus Nanoperiomorbaceae bacterium]
MAVKRLKATTNSRRLMTTQDFDAITTDKPAKGLVTRKMQKSGRNNQGRITSRHRGGGTKKFSRNVNFNLPTGNYEVREIEYAPDRSARLARIQHENGDLHYMPAPQNVTKGAKIAVGADIAVEAGNRLQLKAIPLGSSIHNIELTAGHGGQAVRAAGTSATLTSKDGDYALVRMPSGEVRKFRQENQATIGVVGNNQHQNIKIGSAGRKRHMGIRPQTRGRAMNAVDHPNGGGDGGAGSHRGVLHTPWGQVALGKKTRSRKSTDKMIVRSRHQAKRRK